MRTLLFLVLIAVTALAGEIIPVAAWPRVLNLPDKQIVNASVADCVAAGYRLLPAESAPPAGKQVKTRTVIQDPDDASMAKIVYTYENIPIVIPPPPEVLTNVPSAKVRFQFTTNGQYRGVIWIDAPIAITNVVVIQ